MNQRVKMRSISKMNKSLHIIFICLFFILIINRVSASSALDSIVKAIFNGDASSSSSSSSSSSGSSSPIITSFSNNGDDDQMLSAASSPQTSITVNPSKLRSSFKSLVFDPFAALVKSAAASVSAASITSLGSSSDVPSGSVSSAASSDYEYIGDDKPVKSKPAVQQPTADQMLAATGQSRYFILDSAPGASSSAPISLPPSVIQPYSYNGAPIFAANPYYPLPLIANSQLLPVGTAAAAAAAGGGGSILTGNGNSNVPDVSSMTSSASNSVEVRKSEASGVRSLHQSTSKFRSNASTAGKKKNSASSNNIRGKNYVSGTTGGGTGLSIGSADGGGLALKWGKTQLTFKRDAGGPVISLGPSASTGKTYATIKNSSKNKHLKSNLAKFSKSSANYYPAESSQSYSSARRPASKGKKYDDDDEGSNLPFIQLPSISIGGGGGSHSSGPMISFGSSKSSSEDSYSSTSYSGGSKSYDKGYKKDYDAKPKITLQIPDFPKTIIESGVRLPAIKMKLNASPFVKVTTNSRDPLEPPDNKNETGTSDIFMKPKPFPKKFKNGTIIPLDENGNPIGTTDGVNGTLNGQYPIYGDPYNPYTYPGLNQGVSGHPLPGGHHPPPPSHYRHAPPAPPSPVDGYAYHKTHTSSHHSSNSAQYGYNREYAHSYQHASPSNAIGAGARRQEHGEVSPAASSPSNSYVHQQSIHSPPSQQGWYPSNQVPQQVPHYSTYSAAAGPGHPGQPLNLLPNPYTKVQVNSPVSAPTYSHHGVKGGNSYTPQYNHQQLPIAPGPPAPPHSYPQPGKTNYNHQYEHGVKGYGYNYTYTTEKPDIDSGKEVVIYDSVGPKDKAQIILNVKPRIQLIMGNKTRYEKPKDQEPFLKVMVRPTFVPTTTESPYKSYDQQKENEVRKSEFGFPRDVNVNGGSNAVDGSSTTAAPTSTTEEDYEYDDELDDEGNRKPRGSTTPKPGDSSSTTKKSTGDDDEEDYDDGDSDSPVKLSTLASGGTSTTPSSISGKNTTAKFDDEANDDEDALDVPLTDDATTAKPTTVSTTTVSSRRTTTKRSGRGTTSLRSTAKTSTTTSKPNKEEEGGNNGEDDDEDYKDEDDKEVTSVSTTTSTTTSTTESSVSSGNRLSSLRDARRKKQFGDRTRTVNSGGSVTNSVRKKKQKSSSTVTPSSSGNTSHEDDTNDTEPVDDEKERRGGVGAPVYTSIYPMPHSLTSTNSSQLIAKKPLTATISNPSTTKSTHSSNDKSSDSKHNRSPATVTATATAANSPLNNSNDKDDKNDNNDDGGADDDDDDDDYDSDKLTSDKSVSSVTPATHTAITKKASQVSDISLVPTSTSRPSSSVSALDADDEDEDDDDISPSLAANSDNDNGQNAMHDINNKANNGSQVNSATITNNLVKQSNSSNLSPSKSSSIATLMQDERIADLLSSMIDRVKSEMAGDTLFKDDSKNTAPHPSTLSSSSSPSSSSSSSIPSHSSSASSGVNCQPCNSSSSSVASTTPLPATSTAKASVDYDDEESGESDSDSGVNSKETTAAAVPSTTTTTTTTRRPTGRAQKTPFVFGQKVSTQVTSTTTTSTTEAPSESLDDDKEDDVSNEDVDIEVTSSDKSLDASNKDTPDADKVNGTEAVLPSDQVPIIVVLVPPEEAEDFAAKAQLAMSESN